MKRLHGIRFDRKTGKYKMTCPFCRESMTLGGDSGAYCVHMVFAHETVNNLLIYCTAEWDTLCKELLLRSPGRVESFVEYLYENGFVDEDEDKTAFAEAAEEAVDEYFDNGFCSVSDVVKLLHYSPRKKLLDSVVIRELADEYEGGGSYYLFCDTEI